MQKIYFQRFRIYDNESGGNKKYVDIYNINLYRIYYHLYLSNNFNYCAIYIITYFIAFGDNIFSGQRILFEEITLNKIYNIILTTSKLNLLKPQKIEFTDFEEFATYFLLAVSSRHRYLCPLAAVAKPPRPQGCL